MTALARTLDTGQPLVVDLDDTLVRTDLLFEQMLLFIKAEPWRAPLLMLWALRGSTELKAQLANAVSLDVGYLPYRVNVIDLVAAAKAAGRTVILASASHSKVVEAVAAHLQFFACVLATTDENLKGERKLAAIRARIGPQGFAYVGDAAADLQVWQDAEQIIAVNPSSSLLQKLTGLRGTQQILRDRKPLLPQIIKQMRPHQWVKNLLVFVPLIAGHHINDVSKIIPGVLVFVAFSLLASAVYVMNDLLDVDADRAHHSKKSRPFASGDLPLKFGFILLPSLLLASAAVATTLGPEANACLAAYFALNIAYTLRLKEALAIDTVILATFYTLRILAGGAATGDVISPWLLAFSVFLFFGLAMVKRYTELLRSKNRPALHRRGYRQGDQLSVYVTGVASTFLAVLVLVLYLNSQAVSLLYRYPQRLWPVAPAMLYWTSRIWLLAHRGEIDDDPVVFSVRDRISWGVFIAVALILYAAV